MRLSNPTKPIVLICVSLLFLQASSIAESASSKRPIGKIEGVIVDPYDARIVKASVKVKGKRIKREIVSDGEGRFQIELPVGIYQITIYSPGFGIFQQRNVKVLANSTTALNIPLKVAAVGPCPDAKHKGKGIVICM